MGGYNALGVSGMSRTSCGSPSPCSNAIQRRGASMILTHARSTTVTVGSRSCHTGVSISCSCKCMKFAWIASFTPTTTYMFLDHDLIYG